MRNWKTEAKECGKTLVLTALPDIVYTPTFVLMDGGREIGRIVGYPGEDFFWSLLGELVQRLPAESES